MGLERAEFDVAERGRYQFAEPAAREVLVTEQLSHVNVEHRVVAIRLDDHGPSAWFENPPVFGERSLGMLHMVEGVFRMNDVEARVVKWQVFAVGDEERKPLGIAPFGRALDVDRDDIADTLPQQLRDAAVSAADVEQSLATRELDSDLREAAFAIPSFAGVHGPAQLIGIEPV